MSFRFTRLRLENWRNFREVDVELQQRAFIVGPNASGKTNLIDAFRFLRDLASPEGGLAFAVGLRGGMQQLRSLHAKPQSPVTVEISLVLADERWSYSLQLDATKALPPRVVSERVVHGNKELLRRPTKSDKADPELLGQTHLEQLSQNRAFRPLVEALASVQAVHVVPQIAKDPALRTADGVLRDAPGSDFIDQLAKLPKKRQAALLTRITALLRVAVPQFSALGLAHDPSTGIPHLLARYDHWRSKTIWQNEQEFSDGTLRLIGLLCAILQGTTPLMIEEPELSLHESVVRHLPILLTSAALHHDRQLLITTHSELMLGIEGIDPSELILLVSEATTTRALVGSHKKELVNAARAGLVLDKMVSALTRPRDIAQLPVLMARER